MDWKRINIGRIFACVAFCLTVLYVVAFLFFYFTSFFDLLQDVDISWK